MKINEVEAAVGVTKKNIRFYEEEGLISPSREPGNGYRSYSRRTWSACAYIKLLRKLDVPLAEIRQMLEGQCTLADGMSQQLERLCSPPRRPRGSHRLLQRCNRNPAASENWMWSRRWRV